MRLSEAMREGAKLRPQCVQFYFSYNDSGVLCSCAFGAVYEAIAGKPGKHGTQVITVINDALGYQISEQWAMHPVRKNFMGLFPVVMELNDKGWTREAIADWLESIGY